MSASVTLTRPPFPIINPDGEDFIYQSPLRFLTSPQPPRYMPCRGFTQLSCVYIKKDIIQVFLNLSELSQVIQAFTEGRCSSNKLDALLDCRNLVQHQLLSLPDETEPLDLISLDKDTIQQIPQFAVQIYKSCRVAALLYSTHVTFPLPRTTQTRLRVVPELQTTICEINLRFVEEQVLRVLLWCTVVTGIASKGAPEHPWFVAQLLKLSDLLDIRSWQELQEIMRGFAWVDTACDQGGYALWEESHVGPQISEQD